MVSQTVEYALRAVVTIAQHQGHPCTARQIAQITQVPAPYLSKLLQGLVRANVVSSQRGLHGGFILVLEPKELTVWDVVDAVEPFRRILKCPLDLKSHSETLCPLHRRLDDAMAMVEQQFRATTIEAVLAEPGAVTPLCQEQKLVMIQENLNTHKVSVEKKSKKTDPVKET